MTFLPIVSSPLPPSDVVYPLLSKFSHITKIILFGCHPLDGVTRGYKCPDITAQIKYVGYKNELSVAFKIRHNGF